MNHAEANETICEYWKVVLAAVNRAGLKYGGLSSADGDDLSQDIVVHLLSYSLPRYDGRLSVKVFVYTMADRYARKALSRRRTFDSYDMTEGGYDAESGEPTGHIAVSDTSGVDLMVAAAIECARLQVAIGALSDKERALLAAMVDGSCKEFATEYGLTPVQMSRAKTKVREKLA